MPDSDNEPKRPRPVIEVVEEPKPVSTPVTDEEVINEPTTVVEEVETPAMETEEKSVPELQSPAPAPSEDLTPPPEAPSKSNFKIIFAVSVITALVVGFVAGGVYVYFTGVRTLQNGETTVDTTLSSPAPLPTSETPTPTATPEPVNVSEYSISILNGSGIVGEANRANALVEDNGFTVVNTGNASTFDYTDTVIQATSTVPEAVIDQLEETLSKEYSVKIGDPLSESSNYDIVITLGAE